MADEEYSPAISLTLIAARLHFPILQGNTPLQSNRRWIKKDCFSVALLSTPAA
jgi:hypothetical protein